MNFLKIKLLVIALIVFAASSAFASLSYEVTVNTSSLVGTSGYLYLQYDVLNKPVASTATVSSFSTDGLLATQNDTVDVVNGSKVTGTLPGNVVFANTNTINDYNHAITFGSTLSFMVSFASTPAANTSAVSTFSLGLFGDAYGSSALLNTAGVNYSVPGTVAMINLNNDGSTSTTSLDSSTEVTPTPIPAAIYLLGSGLMGLVGMRKRKQI